MFKIERVYSKLLAIIAKELGYDFLTLSHDFTKPLTQDNNYKDTAMLMLYNSYDTVPLLNADGSPIEIGYLDCNMKLRDIKDSYKELTAVLYKILDNGGTLKYDLEYGEKSKKNSIIAADVPEFMIECVLHNLV